MTKAFRKEGVSQNAVAQLAPITELYFVDRVQFNSISFTPGKLAEFAEKCREHIVEDVKKKVLSLKTKGSLLPFCLCSGYGDWLEQRRHRRTHTRRGTMKEIWEHAGDSAVDCCADEVQVCVFSIWVKECAVIG
ncbi:hypothetical protein DPX16_15662 [Anabarilius grahami]|uniref:Uncharacterized protein n=1 Tax=Anabarilius grahami TaxID=495550 RepID=A0A3N0YT30_ANAGA|nr:hypothetical protein DPX16_15662 [Anabarilius grahami]